MKGRNFIKYMVNPAGLALLIVLLLTFTAAAFAGNRESVPINSEQVSMFNEGWEYVNEAGDSGMVELPVKLRAEAGETVRLTRRIPEDIPEPVVLCFRTAHQTVEVSFNGVVLYRFGMPDSQRLFGKTPGNAWNLVRLPENCGNGEVTIKLSSPYGPYAGRVNEVYYGTKASLVFFLYEKNLAALVITTVIMLMGLLMITLYYSIMSRSGGGKDMLYLGTFALLSAMWMFGEARVTQFFIKDQFGAMCLTFLFLLLFPIPLFKFVAGTSKFRYRREFGWMVRLMYAQIVAACILQFMNVCDFIQMLPVNLGVFLCVAVIGFRMVFLDWYRYKNRHSAQVLVCLTVYSFFAAAECYFLYFCHARYSGWFIRIGTFAFLLIEAVSAVCRASLILRLSRVASVDVLTGCQNRTAYIKSLETLKGKTDMAAVMADLNDLKLINDTMGHEAGDDALVTCALYFRKVFEGRGVCYRIGGDEFLFLGKGITQEELDSLLNRFYRLCEDENVKSSCRLRVAAGSALFDGAKDTCLEDTVRRADRQMYRIKQQMKKQAAAGNQELSQ